MNASQSQEMGGQNSLIGENSIIQQDETSHHQNNPNEDHLLRNLDDIQEQAQLEDELNEASAITESFDINKSQDYASKRGVDTDRSFLNQGTKSLSMALGHSDNDLKFSSKHKVQKNLKPDSSLNMEELMINGDNSHILEKSESSGTTIKQKTQKKTSKFQGIKQSADQSNKGRYSVSIDKSKISSNSQQMELGSTRAAIPGDEYKLPPGMKQRRAGQLKNAFRQSIVPKNPGLQLTNEELAKKIEKERLQQLHESAEKLKTKLQQIGRCGICTLMPPCKHTELLEQQLREKQQLILEQEQAELMNTDISAELDEHQERRNIYHHVKKQQTEASDNGQSKSPANKHRSVEGSQGENSPDRVKVEYISDNPQPYSKTLVMFGQKHLRGSYHHGQDQSSRLSPYSILKTSRDVDLDSEIQKLKGMGFKNTRASVLKQLHLRKQFEENPNLARYPKSKPQNESLNTSQFNFNSDQQAQHNPFRLNQSVDMKELGTLQNPQIRIRNKRGQYESVDGNSVNFSLRKHEENQDQMKYAEQRLRVIEQISKYREEKIKREFMKLEEELKREEERIKQEKEKEHRRRQHMEDAKRKLEDYQRLKEEKDRQDRERQDQMRQSIKLQQLQIIKHNDELAQGSQANMEISQISSNSKERKSVSPIQVTRYRDRNYQNNLMDNKNYHIRIDKQQWQISQEQHMRNQREVYPKIDNKVMAYGIYNQSVKVKDITRQSGGSTKQSMKKNQLRKSMIQYIPMAEKIKASHNSSQLIREIMQNHSQIETNQVTNRGDEISEASKQRQQMQTI
ncbi:UNKNOWN [Stylonychia lemnae]|uniref:Uncharacterized protein n=1 Tax=Stylonychia lemnae TaxID=5949 RepID=A0A077ZWU9_STYLE|nr:UNKNOWN [Stylonychia lemnae]|eukprot:CDW74076.1 UNKNOWN [Stylonychia lemnae]